MLMCDITAQLRYTSKAVKIKVLNDTQITSKYFVLSLGFKWMHRIR